MEGAAALYEKALAALLRGHGDAARLVRSAAAQAPAFPAAHLLEASLLVHSRNPRDVEAAGWVFARLKDLPLDHRGRRHAAAIGAALDGELPRARAIYDGILDASPHDLLALWAAQVIDYYLGDPHAQLARSERVLKHWSPSEPGFHAVLAMLAFSLEESGDYAAAEEAARRALDLAPDDLRAEHALLHVLEMQGRATEGLRRTAVDSVNHLLWHRALFHLQLGHTGEALAVYDHHMRLEALPDLIDASALLWRLSLAGVDVGTRFERLAAEWAPHAEDAYCAFNDMHAMMAFAGARRWDWAERLLRAQERRVARGGGSNYHMTRLVGLPASRALSAFARGDFRTAEALLRSLPPVAHRIGGSHAQRDVMTLTRAAAATRRPRTFPGDTIGFAPQALAAA